ncbi:syndetin-like isoform X4 [Mangifera indica]|uniref:syndetin-like isoform X4 n=1 Tax=Mangifera indica TaxID=29780 RepID=UPI001CFBF7D4|nr:syndetin-like isoform X4 [Mangifera indica]
MLYVWNLYLLNGRYVDLMLEEFKRYKTRLAHGGIRKEVQDHLLEYEVEIVAEILIEGLSRVKRCTDEGQAFLSLDLQVFINGLQHFVSINVKPKIQIVETFIKVTMSIVNCYKISKSRAKYEVKEVLLV